MRASRKALLGMLLTIGLALPARALPPLERVTDGLTRFRSSTGDVLGEGRLTYLDFREERVRLERRWGEPPRLALNLWQRFAASATPSRPICLPVHLMPRHFVIMIFLCVKPAIPTTE